MKIKTFNSLIHYSYSLDSMLCCHENHLSKEYYSPKTAIVIHLCWTNSLFIRNNIHGDSETMRKYCGERKERISMIKIVLSCLNIYITSALIKETNRK